MTWLAAAFLVPLHTSTIGASTCPTLADTNRVLLSEAFRLERAVGDSVWPGFTNVPFIVLLVDGNWEYLVNHPSPSSDFEPAGTIEGLGTVLCRSRQFAPNLLATFPAVGGKSTVVVGTPTATHQSPSAWVVTLLHEHFHQLQNSQPGYYAGVDSLDLSGGDKTGMWMLNFPFPYDSAAVVAAFERVAAMVRPALDGRGATLAEYESARAALRRLLTAAQERYLEFQLWQEGIARYTEFHVARLASGYVPASQFTQLNGYRPFREVADSLRSGIVAGVTTPKLRENRRVAFYSLGAAIGLLMDVAEPTWRSQYFVKPFIM